MFGRLLGPPQHTWPEAASRGVGMQEVEDAAVIKSKY